MINLLYRHWLSVSLLIVFLSILSIGSLNSRAQNSGDGWVSGELKKWHTVTIDFAGPSASEMDSAPNPFLDYRLQVTFTGPSGRSYNVPGFFDGDGNGSGSGNVWRVRFTPDEAGTWSYVASFRTGTNVAIDLDPDAGTGTHFDGTAGSFTVAARDPDAPGFLKWGWLEYVGNHYLKFRDGPYWLKGGTNSPETFLGYSGFDNTTPGPFGLLDFANHVQDWQAGDPDWGDGKGKGIIGALNYFEEKHINSVYFLPMNIGGDGRNTWPYAGTVNPGGSPANDNTHFDISKLYQWDTVFDHAQKKGVMLHFVLNEAEKANKNELDDATLGIERKLYYRELIARFGHYNALQWNIAEEYDFHLPLDPDTVKHFAGYIQAVDPYDHPITVHNNADPDTAWTPFLGDSRFSVTSFQYPGSRRFPFNVARYGAEVEEWREKTANAGRPLPIGLDELRATTATNIDEQRKELLWPTYLSGGTIEHFIGGGEIDKTLDDFRLYEALWTYTWYARKFLEENLPFSEMQPNDTLLAGESTSFGGGQVFAKENVVYAIYLPDASASGTLDLSSASGIFVMRWYNPRNGNFEGAELAVAGGSNVSLGAPPSDLSEDWVVLLQREDLTGTATPTATLTPCPPSPTATPSPAMAVIGFTLINAETDQPLFELNNGAILDLAQLPTDKLNIRANTNPEVVGSVKFSWNDTLNYRIENTAPYALAGDNGGDYLPWTPPEGTHTLAATPYSEPDGQGEPGASYSITIQVTNGGQTDIFVPMVEAGITGCPATPTPSPTATSTSTPTAITYTLLVSTSPDRSNPVALHDQTVSGNIYVFTSPDDPGIEQVHFYLDDPNMEGNPRQVEDNAPYDFAGGSSSTANPWDTATAADGQHQISAVLKLLDGTSVNVMATFTIANSN